MKTRKIPLRMCTGCGQMFDKRTLIRVVKNKEGDISLDITGKKPGRGAYICKNRECFVKMRKGKRLEHAFKSPVPPQVYERLEAEFDAMDGARETPDE